MEVKHILINRPDLQVQLFVYDQGKYLSVEMEQDPNYFYITGKDGMNCISFPNDMYRAVWNKQMVDIIVEELNTRFPVEKIEAESEKPVDVIETE